MTEPLVNFTDAACSLHDVTALPRASGFLWNRKMMLHMTARGFATAQHMQPEPAKYAHAPVLEAKNFMMPEQPYFAHHPGRFVYVWNRDTDALFSAPYEPVRQRPDSFTFTQFPERIEWLVRHGDIEISLTLVLPVDDACELWRLVVRNVGEGASNLRVVPYFPVGYMSWMNQSAAHEPGLSAIVARSVTPYQKVADYFKNMHLKDITFLAYDQAPDATETRREDFEGDGGLTNPIMIRAGLENQSAAYETPAAILSYDLTLAPHSNRVWHFVFGPAKDDAEITKLRGQYLGADAFARVLAEAKTYQRGRTAALEQVSTPNQHLNAALNTWIPRQVFYHGDTNRLSTDPQTRNYLQDALGMVYLRPETARAVLLHALSQQNENGSMPDGITLYEGAELKYINLVPHTDHCVWLPMLLEAYLDETNDLAVLDVSVADRSGQSQSVRERLDRAMAWLIEARDHRLLNFIEQGDWNDPMNMVGYKGRGVSGWLTLATVNALRLWARLSNTAAPWLPEADRMAAACQQYLWSGDWFARGITDDDVVFGVPNDPEGSIYLNPQSFAFMAGLADGDQQSRIIRAVEHHLETPYGVEMLGPPYTKMRDDVGRLTQKSPGVAENGAVYNHAAAFYIYSLYQIGQSDKAFSLLSRMLAGPDLADYLQKGQLPIFVPNYYRGDWRRLPRTAGRSSQLFNTGTIAWVYRILIEGMFGLKGCAEGLRIAPQLPADWDFVRVTRQFRGCAYDVTFTRNAALTKQVISVDGVDIGGNVVVPVAGRTRARVLVEFP